MSICNIDKDDVFNDLETYRATYSLCITNVSISSIDILESLIRELNKIFLSMNNTFRYLDNNVTLRNGIALTNLNDSNIERAKNISLLGAINNEAFFEKKVFLQLYVKVEKDWRNRERKLRNFGYQLEHKD